MSIIKPRLKRPATRNVPWPVCRRFNCKLGTQSVHWLMIVQEVPCPCHLVILGSTISDTSIQKTTKTNLSTGEPMGTNCYFYWKGIHFTGLGVQNAPHRLQWGQHVRIVENVFVQEPHRPGHFFGLRENTSIDMGRWWSQWIGYLQKTMVFTIKLSHHTVLWWSSCFRDSLCYLCFIKELQQTWALRLGGLYTFRNSSRSVWATFQSVDFPARRETSSQDIPKKMVAIDTKTISVWFKNRY